MSNFYTKEYIMQNNTYTRSYKPPTLPLGMALEYDGFEFNDTENTGEEGDPDAALAASMYGLEFQAKRILSSDQPAIKFELTKDGTYRRDQFGNPIMRITALGKELLTLRHTLPRERLRELVPCKEFHPRAELLFKIIDDARFRYFSGSSQWLTTVMDNNQTFGEYLNQLLSTIRSEAKKASFKKKIREWSSRANKNYRSLIAYFDGLFDLYQKLLFVRIDLGYRIGYRDFNNPALTVEKFERFLRNRRSNPKIFQHCIGYAWRLECAPKKGLHYHCILIFDGSKAQSDVHLANIAGEYWRDSITKEGSGTFWNCNKTRYKHHGIGLIDRDDTAKRQILANMVAPYLTKLDAHMRVNIPKGMTKFRTFGKAELPDQPVVKRARRRKVNKPTLTPLQLALIRV
ncbi:inovirus-type Gp2 protein [uncultured Deefgea sp.]|uniref:YagK/YfjJ domain-containing protein n=1 Tax=uncultured Deefgea sp. TaxID=1304914 RepID=UPI0025989946|nr:inovirus-type Gp2 protein [uncultured Deefgea sp.]